MQPNFSLENNYPKLVVCGIDEAGRGPLAGPVVAACVILNQTDFPSSINDSKKLSKAKRREIFLSLKKSAKFGIGIVDAKMIDKINILQATKLAMLNSFIDLQEKYKIFPEVVLIDGNFVPFEKQDKICAMQSIIKGDQKSLSIAAASIIAKETRDEIMNKAHQKFPQFGFDKHAGYPTKFHIEKIGEFGICNLHRKSFKPIKAVLHENN
jgi:ribonuclease HII